MKTILLVILTVISLKAQVTEIDTLETGTDSIAVFNNNNAFDFIEVAVKGATATDSFYVERYSPYTDDWSRIGAQNELTGEFDQIIAVDTTTNFYLILYSPYQYAEHLRIRRYNVYSADKTSYVTWFGKSQ